jgi:hypothetical protein
MIRFWLLNVVLLVLSVSSHAAVLRVCESCAVRKISDAIHLARPADTIEIDGGTYHEGIIRIFKPLRIVGIHNATQIRSARATLSENINVSLSVVGRY